MESHVIVEGKNALEKGNNLIFGAEDDKCCGKDTDQMVESKEDEVASKECSISEDIGSQVFCKKCKKFSQAPDNTSGGIVEVCDSCQKMDNLFKRKAEDDKIINSICESEAEYKRKKKEERKKFLTGNQSYTCNACNKTFTRYDNLEIHFRTHTGERPFACNFCEKGFIQAGDLKKHLYIHTNERPYNCKYCTKSFTQSVHLKTHLRIHTGEKPFSCTYCPKSFTDSCNLKRHMRIHTGEKPFICKHCQKSFTHSNSLKLHLTYPCTPATILSMESDVSLETTLALSTSVSLENNL